MERTLTGELRSQVGKPAGLGERVRLCGWLHHQRRLARLTFVLLRDRTGLAQIVVEEPEAMKAVARLLPETVLEVEATVVASEQAPGGIELRQPAFNVLSEPAEPPPIELRRPELKEQLPTILDHAAVALRHPRQREAFRIAAVSVAGFRATLDGLGFTEIQSPKIVASATEGGSNVFRVDYFGREAFLAQSPAVLQADDGRRLRARLRGRPRLPRRAARHVRHLAEYVSLDAELGFIRDHLDVMARAPRRARGDGRGRVACRRSRARRVPTCRPSRDSRGLHFGERDRRASTRRARPRPGRRAVARRVGAREHGSDFLFVTGYPMAKRPFYTHPDPAGREFSNSFDLLFRGLELVTGGQRLHRYDDYVAALAARALDPSPTRATSSVPLRHAAARRLRHRPRALGRQAHRRAEHPRDHVVPSRPASSESLASRPGER